MSDKRTTTPPGVFKSPRICPTRPSALSAALAAFDQCLTLTHRSLRADANVTDRGWDRTQHAHGEKTAADAYTCAVTALEAFCLTGPEGGPLLTAAQAMCDILAHDGVALDALAERTWCLRQAASDYAAMPIPVVAAMGLRLIAAADLMDMMLEVALDELVAMDARPISDLHGIPGDLTPTLTLSDHPLSIPEMDLA